MKAEITHTDPARSLYPKEENEKLAKTAEVTSFLGLMI
jgi:hypothetical protein